MASGLPTIGCEVARVEPRCPGLEVPAAAVELGPRVGRVDITAVKHWQPRLVAGVLAGVEHRLT